MIRKLAVAVVFLAAHAALAQTPRIISVSPASGGVVGGTSVTIVTDGISYSCPSCSPPYEVSVTFGDTNAASVSTDGSNTIYAVTPPHTPGTVDVTVGGAGGASATAAQAFTFVDDIFRRDFEAILIPTPIAPAGVPVPGAYGSLWTTDFWIHNAGSQDVFAFLGPYYHATPPSSQQCSLCGLAPIPAGKGVSVIAPVGLTGVLGYIQKSGSAAVALSLRVRDISRTAQNEGTEIPVVRERDFSTAPIVLLNVPIDAASRANLRVFNTQPNGDSPAQVNVYPVNGSDLIASTLVDLHPQTIEEIPTDFPGYAGYGLVVDLRSALSLPDGQYRIEVTPIGFPGWAYVAVTNNETQFVTTVTPR